MFEKKPRLQHNTLCICMGSLVMALAALSTPAISQADWTGGVEGGTVIDGDTTGSRLRFKASNNERPFSQQFYADWIYDTGGDSGYELGYTPKYWFSQTTYAFGEGSLRTAKAQAIDRQARVLGGVGIQLLDSKSQSLFAEAGVGQVSTKFSNVVPGVEDTTESQIAQARVGAVQQISNLLKFELDGLYATSDDTTESTAEAGVSVAIPGGAIKYSYRVRSTAIGDADAIDTKDSSVSFTYGF